MEEGNAPNICEFCEASSEIKLKCVNCNLFLCRGCHLKIHSKIKATKDHIGIDIKDYCTESIVEKSRKVNLKQMSCVKHTQKTCFMFCRDCEQLICSTCVIDSHQQHKLEEIIHAYNEKERTLKNVTVQIDNEIPKVEYHATRLREMKYTGEKNFIDIQLKILQHEFDIKENISVEAKTLLKQVDDRWEVTKDSIIRQRKQIQKSIEDLEKQKAQLNIVLHSRQAVDIFVKDTETYCLLSNTCLSHVQTEQFRLTPSECDLEGIGYLQCIHVNNENQIVVGSRFENESPYEEEYFTGMIMVFKSVDNCYERTLEEFVEELLFSKILYRFLPDRIISTKDNDYCLIVRETLHERKQIARFDDEFGFKWTYDGCCENDFYPIDLTESPTELIFVVDSYKGGAIHVLNRDGNVLTCNLFVNENFPDPLLIDINGTEMLLIGCKKAKENQLAHIDLFKLN
ncbi:uncharacterized protein LOC134726658 [Mytilus trossulus]|uniref:uncharacterized protein LOC134726658 n=1 Tax=Mytilus trossulus TaxID=6551 RepID=UPI0030047185